MFERNRCKTYEEKNIAMVDFLQGKGSCIYKKQLISKMLSLEKNLKLKPKIFSALNPIKGFSLATLL